MSDKMTEQESTNTQFPERQVTLIRLSAVIAKIGLEKSTIYAKIKDSGFPEPVKLSPRCSRWIEEEIDEWIDARISERDMA